jgi:group I intron endonuclease
MTCGIYKIENLVNGKIYIGQSVDIEARWAAHRSTSLKSQQPLYRAIRKYGLDNFAFSILEETIPELLTEAEGRHMAAHRVSGPLYNLAPAAGSTFGFRHSEESKEKMGRARRGIPLSDDMKAKLSDAQRASEATAAHCREMAEAKKGVPHTAEHRAKIGAKSRARIVSEETKEKLRAARLGKKLTPAHRAKLVASLIGNQHTAGRPISDEHRAKVSASLIGNKRRLGVRHTPETRAAMSVAQTKRWAEYRKNKNL